MTLTMDSPKLRKLPRTQLQSLAKRESIRAVGKNKDIIRRLIQKHPKGVPASEDAANPSVSSAPLQQDVPKRLSIDTSLLSPIRGTSGDLADPKGKGKAVEGPISPSPPSSTETLELLYPNDYATNPSDTVPESATVSRLAAAESNTLPDHSVSGRLPAIPPKLPSHQADKEKEGAQTIPASPAGSNPGWQAVEEDIPDNAYDDLDYPKGAPNHYMLVDALRQFTTLVDTIPSMETCIAETWCILKRTKTLLEKMTPDARELTATREHLEISLLSKMKEKPELWDGTAKLKKSDRKDRMEWLRAERKAENERNWKEVNKLHEELGLKPEPFATFASQSDEEIIESLQTTPTSSRNGSSKRKREERVDGESDEDYSTDGEKRKRSCTP